MTGLPGIISLHDNVQYSSGSTEDSAGLRAMARTAFAETFSHLFQEEQFTAFLNQVYGPGGGMDRDLGDPSIKWRIARNGPDVVGYAKLRPLAAPAPSPQPNSLELQQLYVAERWKGRGVAIHLMEWAIETARSARAAELYLTVLDHNERAKRFYTRFGFSEIGRCTFVLGDQTYDDRVWRMLLGEQASTQGHNPAPSPDAVEEDHAEGTNAQSKLTSEAAGEIQ